MCLIRVVTPADGTALVTPTVVRDVRHPGRPPSRPMPSRAHVLAAVAEFLDQQGVVEPSTEPSGLPP